MFSSLKYIMGSLIAALLVVYDIEYAPLTKGYGRNAGQESDVAVQVEKPVKDPDSIFVLQNTYAPGNADSAISGPDQTGCGSKPF